MSAVTPLLDTTLANQKKTLDNATTPPVNLKEFDEAFTSQIREQFAKFCNYKIDIDAMENEKKECCFTLCSVVPDKIMLNQPNLCYYFHSIIDDRKKDKEFQDLLFQVSLNQNMKVTVNVYKEDLATGNWVSSNLRLCTLKLNNQPPQLYLTDKPLLISAFSWVEPTFSVPQKPRPK